MTAASGRAEAFERHIVPELESLYRVALVITGHRFEAEDLVQDTLVRAYRGLDGFDGAHPRAWLLTILRNTHISRNRRQRPSLLHDPDLLAEVAEPTSVESGPESVAMATVLDARVEAAFESLASDQQMAIRLVDMDGLSYREAADVLGVPIGTLMSRLHRGRSRIKRRLAVTGFDGGRP